MAAAKVLDERLGAQLRDGLKGPAVGPRVVPIEPLDGAYINHRRRSPARRRRYRAALGDAFTISFFVLPTMAISSSCSFDGTLNVSRVLRKSATIACHWASLMFRCSCASFIDRPLYLHGPPVTSQTSVVTWNLSPAFGTRLRASLIAGFALSVSLTSNRSMKSSTTVAML